MKTLILTAVMFLTVALARPAVADKLTLFSGYIVWTETAQFVGGKILIDGAGTETRLAENSATLFILTSTQSPVLEEGRRN